MIVLPVRCGLDVILPAPRRPHLVGGNI